MALKRILAAAFLVAAVGCETETDDYTPERGPGTTDTMNDRTTTTPPTTPVRPTTPGQTTTPPNSTTTPPGSTTGAGSGQVSEDARRFVTEAISGNMFEVQSAQLAQSKNLDQSMQQVVQTILNDHQRALEELRQIARTKNITVQEQLQPKHQQMLDQLRNLSGSEFQQRFYQMQLQAHQEAISLYQQAAQTLQDPELKAYAQRTLPVLQRHLQHIQQAQSGGGATPMEDEDDEPVQPPTTPPGNSPG